MAGRWQIGVSMLRDMPIGKDGEMRVAETGDWIPVGANESMLFLARPMPVDLEYKRVLLPVDSSEIISRELTEAAAGGWRLVAYESATDMSIGSAIFEREVGGSATLKE